jgi:hypothetical protein
MLWVTVLFLLLHFLDVAENEKPPTEVDGRGRTPGDGVRYRMTMTVLVSGSIEAHRSRTPDTSRPYTSRSVT